MSRRLLSAVRFAPAMALVALCVTLAIALFPASLSITPARAQVVASFPRVTYTSTSATLTGNPVTLDAPSVLSTSSVVTSASLGFSFTFYGITYTSVYLSLYGNIQFNTISAASTPLAFPTGAQSVLPVLAFAWTSLAPNASSVLAYKTIGAAPSRQFVVRFSNVPLAAASSAMLSVDVILSESTNTIQLSYYSMPSTTQAATVGMSSAFHDDWTTEWLVLSGLNVATVSATTAAALNGRVFTLTPSSSVPYTSQSATPTPVASGRYYATVATSTSASPGALAGSVALPGTNDAVTAVNLGFSFFFYGTWYVAVNVGANGELQFATSSTSPLTSAMPAGNTGIRPFIGIAYSNWNPSQTGSRTYALSGSPGSYQFTLRYTNVPHNDLPTARLSADLVLFQSDYHIEVRYYLIDPVLTPVVIGVEAADQLSPTVYDYVSVWNNLPMTATASTFLVGKTITYAYANGTITPPAAIPRSYTSTLLSSVRTFQPLVNASFLNGGNDNVDTVNIGFAFWFYGTYYSRVQITCNGDIQFKTRVGAYAPLAMPSMSITRNPYLAYFYTDLAPLSNTARSFSLAGTYPNRVFTLRLDSAPYASTMYNSPAPSVTIDVQLFERNGSIAVSYYNVAASAQYVLIGVEGSGIMRIDSSFDYTDVLNNVTMSSTVASSLTGSTLWLTPRNFSGPPPFVPAQTYRWTRTWPAPQRPVLTSSVYLRPSDDLLYIFSIGFTFTFFGVNYTTVVFSTNGNLQFGPSYSSAWAPQPMPAGNAALAPFIAALFSDMVGFAPDASSEFARLGTAPNRQLLIRMDRYGYRFDSETPALTCDYVLFEGSNRIEIRYYLVTGSIPRSNAAPQDVLVGIQGAVTPRVDNSYDATIVWNSLELPDGVAAQWNNSVLAFDFADPNAPVVAALPDTYTVNVTRGATMMTLTNPTVQALGPNMVLQAAIGFQFSFYDDMYSTVYISTNGNLQFLSTSASAVPVAMPSVGAGTPVIAFFFTGLAPTAASISYATVGTSYPTRQFVVRYTNVPYALNASAAVSCDVVLFELDGRIEIRYFRVDLSPAQNVLIGVQDEPVQRADWSYDFTAFINLEQLQPTVVSQLVGNTVSFSYVTPIAPPPALTPIPCTQQGTYMCTHTLSVVAPVDMTGASVSPFSPYDADDEVNAISIGFSFRFFNRYYTAVNVSSNGNMQFTTSNPQWDSESLPNGNGPLAPFLAFGFADLYANAGTRSYKTFGTTVGSRYFVVRYNRVWFIRSSQTITVDIVLFETGSIELRYYQVGTTLLPTLIGVSDVLPPGGSDFDYAVLLNSRDITDDLSSRLSGSTVVFSRVSQPANPLPKFYSFSLLTTPLPTRTTPPEMRSLPGSNDNIDVVQIGFPFSFYGQYYTSVSVSSNGDLQFRTSNSVFYNAAFPWDDFGRTPFLAFFYTDLYPIASTARSYLRTGTAPSRQFLLRYSDVPYTSTAAQASAPSVAIDVVLMETGYVIEVRYYRIDQSAQLVTIGAQNYARMRADGQFDYSAYWNTVAVTSDRVAALQGKALQFVPLNVPASPPRVPYPSYSMRRNFTVPSKIALTAYSSLPGSGGNTWVYVPLGFTFTFFGTPYTWCNINQNGYIMFASLSLVEAPEPMPYGNFGQLPMIAPYFADLTSSPGYGLWLYQTLGVAPARSFILRMDGIQYAWNSNVQTISVDTLLYETSGRIELRFFAAGWSEGQAPVLIGVQGPPSSSANDGTYDYSVLVNCAYLSEADAIDLAGTSVVFDPVPSGGLLPAAPVPPTYNWTLQSGVPPMITLVSPNVLTLGDDAMTSIPIGFAFPLFGHFYSGFRLDSNGLLQFVTSTLAISPDAIPYGNSDVLPFIAILFTDLAPSSTSSIMYETIGQAPSRTFVLRLTDVPYKLTRATSSPPRVSLDFLIFESSGAMETRFYRVDPTGQNVLVGLQGSNIIRDDWTMDFVVIHNAVPLTTALAQRLNGATLRYTLSASSALPVLTPPSVTPLTVQSRGTYTGVHVLDVPPRVVLPSPLAVSTVADVNVARTIPIGFSFVFYGQTYTTVNVSSNGNLQFARTPASVVSSPDTMPAGNAALRPYIAFFLTSMAPSAAARSYQTIGVQPNRQFVLQLTSVGFVTTLTAIDLDVVLFETSNRIELRYYVVPSYPSPVVIGIQSGQDWADYSVAHNNDVVTDLRALQLTGSLVVFTPTSSIDPTVLTAACAVTLPTSWSATAYPVMFTLEFATTVQQLATVWPTSFVSTVLGTVASSLSISTSLLACTSVTDAVVQVPAAGNTTTPLSVVRFKFFIAGDSATSRSAYKLSTMLTAYVLDRSSALYVQLPSDFSNLLRPSNLSTSVLCNSAGMWVDPSQCPDLKTSPSDSNASGSSSGLSAGAAAGIAIGVVAAVIIVVLLAIRAFRRSEKGTSYMGWKSRSPPSTDIEASQVSAADETEEDEASSIEMSSRA